MLTLEAVSVSFAMREAGDGEHECDAPSAPFAVQAASLSIRPGEFVCIVGHNGSGKSTLAALMCGAHIPTAGSVVVDGWNTADPQGRAMVRACVGRVAQNPEDHMISTIVGDEVAFGPEQTGLDDHEVMRRVHASLRAVGLAGFATREVGTLSGGELERVAIAGVLAMEPQYLVLDEVCAMIDSVERPRLRALVRSLARVRGVGVVQISHDPLEALMSDRILVMDQGRLVWEGGPRAFLRALQGRFHDVMTRGPYVDALSQAVALGYPLEQGVEPEDVAGWCAAQGMSLDVARATQRPVSRNGTPTAAPVLTLQDVSVGYEGEPVLRGITGSIHAGEVMLLAGKSGAGKSTLATAIAGLTQPLTGSIAVAPEGRLPRPGDAGLAFQNPERQFFLPTVRDEVAFAPRNAQDDPAVVDAAVARAQQALGIAEELLDRDPFTLSGGQARAVGLASMLTVSDRLIVLDEPTSGLDAPARARLHQTVRALASAGTAVLVISHDLEEWLGEADRVALLGGGTLVWMGTVDELRGQPAVFARAGIQAPESWRLRALLESHATEHPVTGAVATAPLEATADAQSFVLRDTMTRLADARVLLILLIASVAGVFLTPTLGGLPAWYALLAGVLASAHVSVRRFAAALKPAALLFLFIVAANLVSCDGSASWVIAGPVGLNMAAAGRVALVLGRIAFMVGASLAVTELTTPTQIANACVALARPLRRLRVPVDALGMTLSLALRFIPLVAEETQRIRLSQTARGVRFDEGSLKHRISVWISVLVPLVVGLFRRADHVAASMDARGYDGGATGRSARARRLTTRDVVVLVAGLVVMVAIVVWSRLAATA